MFESFWEVVKFGFAFDLGRSIPGIIILLIIMLSIAVARIIDAVEKKRKGW